MAYDHRTTEVFLNQPENVPLGHIGILSQSRIALVDAINNPDIGSEAVEAAKNACTESMRSPLEKSQFVRAVSSVVELESHPLN